MVLQTPPLLIKCSRDPVVAEALKVRTVGKGSENSDSDILKLATFVSRQPRFNKSTDLQNEGLLDNLVQRFSHGIEDGRKIILMTSQSDETDRESVIGYLYMKTTGEFPYEYLDSMERHARRGMKPAIIFKHFIRNELTSADQLSGDKPRYLDLFGPCKFRYSFYENNQDEPGTVGFLLVAEVDPVCRRQGLSAYLVQEALKELKAKGSHFAVTYARCAELASKLPDSMTATQELQNYIDCRRADKLHPDFGIRFHQKAGGTIICGIPNCAQDDSSHNHMCLMIYRL